MDKEFDKPIPCPSCGKPLEKVKIQKTTLFEYEKTEEEGEFVENGQGETVARCGNCHKIIGKYNANESWGIFPKSNDY